MRSKLRRMVLIFLDAYYRLACKAFVPFVLVALLAPALRLLVAVGPQRACQQLYACSVVREHALAGWAIAAAIPLILIVLYGLGWRAHGRLKPPRVPTIHTVQITDDMPLGTFHLGNDPLAFYYEPPEFRRAVEAVTGVVEAFGKGDYPNDVGVVIRGPAKVGKTRFAVEVLKQAAPGYQLLQWHASSHPRLALPEYDSLTGSRLVLFVDDLPDEVFDPITLGALREAIGHLRQICQSFVVVATFRTPNERAEQDLVRILEHLPHVDLRPMDKESTDGQVFVARLQSYLRDLDAPPKGVDPKQFDGFPGSALLGLEWVKALVPRIPPNAQKILQAMALLRHVGVNVYPEERLRRVAVHVFELNAREWRRARAILLPYQLVQRLSTSAGVTVLRVRNDNYLDECLGDIFPEPDRTFEEYYLELVAALGSAVGSPPDADALFDMSDTLRGSGPGERTWRAQISLKSVQEGLRQLDMEQFAELWARGQTLRGLALANRHLPGDIVLHIGEAAQAFSEALARLGQNVVPVQWANTIHDRGAALAELGRLAMLAGEFDGCRLHKAASLRDLRAALEVFAPQKYPGDFDAISAEIRRVEMTLCP